MVLREHTIYTKNCIKLLIGKIIIINENSIHDYVLVEYDFGIGFIDAMNIILSRQLLH